MPKAPRSKRPNTGNQKQKPHRVKPAYQQEQDRDEQNFNRAPTRASVAPLVPRTDAQRAYDTAISTKQIIFGIGSAGTGKTWYAATRAADALRNGEIQKIILTRPAVEAGENLGFLPGELDEKYAPYLAPFLDALEERLGSGHLEYLLRKKIIDARPLAYMRGATMKNAWVLADEAQNITKTQMKMLLTRIGEDAKFIVTGDPRQTDLAPGQSGLQYAADCLSHIKGVEEIYFTNDDVVRSGICMEVINAFEK